MTKMSDEHVDMLLRRSGQEWRDALDLPTVVAFDDGRRRPSESSVFGRMATGAVGAAVLLIVAAFGAKLLVVSTQPTSSSAATDPVSIPIAVASNLSTPSVSASEPPPASALPRPLATPRLQVVAVGDAVDARGRLVVASDGNTELCTEVMTTLEMGSDNFACSAPRVSVESFDVNRVPGYDNSGPWVSDFLELSGTWTGSSVANAEFVQFARDRGHPTRDVPCAPPVGGWAKEQQDVTKEAALSRLTAEVDANLARYVEPWVTDEFDVIVVGTTGDLESDRATLSSIYPYNLCVVPVDFSSAQLRLTTAALRNNHAAWTVRSDPISDRVVVVLPVVDQNAVDGIVAYGSIVVLQPIVSTAQ